MGREKSGRGEWAVNASLLKDRWKIKGVSAAQGKCLMVLSAGLLCEVMLSQSQLGRVRGWRDVTRE